MLIKRLSDRNISILFWRIINKCTTESFCLTLLCEWNYGEQKRKYKKPIT